MMAGGDEKFRIETDLLGERSLPVDCIHGIETQRALENFPLSRTGIHPALIHAYGEVKRACATVNHGLGWCGDEPEKAQAILTACQEMAEGRLDFAIKVDALQGGAGTSTNMNVNEVLANRSLELMGLPMGAYHRVSPHSDINLHQSTNDTYPTALRVAAIRLIMDLERKVLALQESFQELEKRFAGIVKIGRTEMQDAVLITLGREMGAYAEAFNRDRWRIYKCIERLRVVNLGGTAIGTGLTAPREYIFRVVDVLREQSGINLTRAENLVEATQNADVFVEVSGILKALAVSLIKVCSDIRFLSSGPVAGIGEIKIPARQPGSTLMPGKVNPVIPEAVTQVGLLVCGNDGVLTHACAMGNLELNPFLPLVAHCLLQNLSLLGNACDVLATFCIRDIVVNEERIAKQRDNSPAIWTALVPLLGYERVTQIAREQAGGRESIVDYLVNQNILTREQVEQVMAPEAVCRLGSPRLK